MIMKPVFILLAMTCVAFPANGKDREIGQTELRSRVSSGKSMSVNRILSRMRNRIDGEIIDVRAFDVNGVYYRMMIMKPNGRIGSLVVSGETGRAVPASSKISAAVEAAAKSSDVNNSGGFGGGDGGGDGDGGSGGGASGGSGGGGSQI